MPDEASHPVFSLYDADPQPGLVLDRAGTVRQANQSALTLSRNAGLDNSQDLLPINTASLIQACLQQNRAIEDVESRIPGHTLVWTLIPDSQQGLVLLRGRDATREMQVRDEAIQSSRLYRLITENTTDLISRHAPDGRFIDATPASWRLLGYWPEELRNRTLEEIFPDDRISERLAEARNRLRDDGYATMTLDIRHRDGSHRWFEIASRAIRETYTGAVVEVVSVSRDITARVESEENNRRLADELARAARLATLGELASSIAHEMNQPLATIVNFASASQRYLKQAGNSPEALERVDDGLGKIIHHANRASEVIKRLRAFLSKGRKRTAPVALNDVISEVARLCHWEADKAGIRLRERLSPTNPVVTADPVLLEQVLINLIRNGIEATLDAREAPDTASDTPATITLASSINSQGEPLIEVTDEGSGLDEQAIRQMFQPFYTSKPQGLGIGLSMSRSIIEGFGGFLDARPAETGGLTLTCRFPASAIRPATSPKETHPDD